MSKKNLIIDLSSITWVTYFANIKEYTKSLLIHKIFQNIFFVDGEYKPDGIIIACDSKNVWRKDLYPEYKIRRNTKTDPNYNEVLETMKEIIEFFRNYTNITVVKTPRCESDDIISVIIELTKDNKDAFNIIYANDKDMVQLLNERTILHSPLKNTGRVTYDISNREYDLFEKCIRGDKGDDIDSAFSGVRSKVLKEAWENPSKMLNLMEEWDKKSGRFVKEGYKLNRSLIDLSLIPEDIKTSIMMDLKKELDTVESRYNYVKIMNFLSKNDLVNIAKEVAKYSKIFKKSFVF